MVRQSMAVMAWLLMGAAGNGVARAQEADVAEGVPAEVAGGLPEEDVVDDIAVIDSPPAETASRVRLTLGVKGEIFAPAGRDAAPLRRPITLDARFDFVETPAGGQDQAPVERRYLDASADLHIDGQHRRATLADDARTVTVVLRGTMPSPYLAGGFLSREEMDLLETPFDPLLIDALRPSAPLAPGASWEIAGDVAAGLLGIDTVESGGIKATLEEIVDGRAVVKLSGIVDGAADGVPAHVTVEGSYVAAVDDAAEPVMVAGRITTLSVTLLERREASHVAPGFDVEARLSIARAAETDRGQADQDAADAASPVAAEAGRRRGTGRPGLVWQRDAAGRFDLVHDERWRVVEDGSEGLVMRFVDRGALVAQCSITALPRSPAQSPPTIAEVERDVERSLAGQFGRIVHSSEATRSDGVRLVRVVTAGRAGDLPFRWMHHVLTDATGHRLAVTCMLEESMEKRFGSADRELIDGVMLPAMEGVSAAKTAESDQASTDREARLPKESRTP